MPEPQHQTLNERLADPDARFTASEMAQIFEALGPKYGWHRSKDLPPKEVIQQTASLTMPGFEWLAPVVIVRSQTMRDRSLRIPNLIDQLLGANMRPSAMTHLNASYIAQAYTVIVSPVGLVDMVLDSTDSRALGFFGAFSEEYKKWCDSTVEEITTKKSGPMMTTATGSESASSSGHSTDTAPEIPDG